MSSTAESSKQKEKSQNLRRIRMHISGTKWLRQYPVLKDNSVFIESERDEKIELSSNLLSKTQRSIYQVRKSKKLASELLGSSDKWVEDSLNELEIFKIINSIPVNSIYKFILEAPPQSELEKAKILSLLEIEAHLVDTDKNSALGYIFKYFQDFESCLEEYICQYTHSIKARALAAIILGGGHKKHNLKNNEFICNNILKGKSKWIKNSFEWAKKEGLPRYPVLTCQFLKSKASPEDIHYLNKSRKESTHFPIPNKSAKIILRKGVSPDELINLYRKTAKLKSSIDLLNDIAILVNETPKKNQVKKKQDLERRLAKELDNLSYLINLWIVQNPSKDTIATIISLIETIHSLGSDCFSSLQEIIYVLKSGLELKSSLRLDWIKIILEHHLTMWVTHKKEKKSFHTLARKKDIRSHLDISRLLLTQFEDKKLVSEIIENYIYAEVLQVELKDKELVKLIITWCQKLKVNRTWSLWDMVNTVRSYKTKESAIKNLGPLIEVISNVEEQYREHANYAIFENVESFSKPQTSLKSMVEALPDLIQATIEDRSDTCPCYALFYCAVHINNSMCKGKAALTNTLTNFYRLNFGLTFNKLRMLEQTTKFALAFIEHLEKSELDLEYINCKRIPVKDTTIYKELLGSLVLLYDFEQSEFTKAGMLELKSRKELLTLLIDKLRSHPKQVFEQINNLGIISRFSPQAKSRLDKLKRFNDLEINNKTTKTMVAKGWKEIIDRVPDLKPLVLSYIYSKSITGQSQRPGAQISKVLKFKDKLVKEKEYLESFAKGKERTASLDIRIKNLNARIDDDEEIENTISQQLKRHVYHISKQAELEAIEHVIKEAYKYQLKKITGEAPENIAYDSYLRNALLLTQDIVENKRLLKKLIRNSVSSEPDFRFGIGNNQEFLKELKTKWNIKKNEWLSANPKTYMAKNIPGGKIHLKLENDALKVLEMGNYFDTCLSFGGINSYSTVTNACDLNKRVIYAFNTNGVVVGRKLIAISKEGNLVGFKTYTSVDTKEGRGELRTLINSYIKEFAQKANLKLADQGEVLPLSSTQWYDDGVVKWSTEPTAAENKKTSKSKSHSNR